MTSAPLRISVVIPVKDDADRLERCLRALANQTDRPDEIVVVDNGSTDRTGDVMAAWGVVAVHEAEPGIPAAASAGYDAATGDILARLDADSVPPPGWVARVRAAFDGEPALAGVTGPGSFDSLPRGVRQVVDITYMRAYFAVFGHLLGRPPLFGSNFAMRSNTWRAARTRVHRHDARVHDDLDLSFNLDRGAKIELDRDLVVPVSARPFVRPLALVWRAWRGILTVAVNWEWKSRESDAGPATPNAPPTSTERLT